MKVKKFESFEESFEEMESDVELIMQGLVDNLGLKKKMIDEEDPDDWSPINGDYFIKKSSGRISNSSISSYVVYVFVAENPFETSLSNSEMMVHTLNKLKFMQDLVEGISKITSRLDKFGYEWRFNYYNGDDQIALYVFNKSNKKTQLTLPTTKSNRWYGASPF